MIIVIGIAYLCCYGLCFYLTRKAINNQYGWGERTNSKARDLPFFLMFSLFGPVGLFIVFLSDWQYCFMSKKEALKLYDAKNLRKYGYYIGREIAKDEGRLPEGTPLT